MLESQPAQFPPSSPETFVDTMLRQAADRPDAPLLTFLHGDDTETTQTYGQFVTRSLAVAQSLADEGLRGERVLLMFPPGLEHVSALVGCMCAGVIGVPALPPDPVRLRRSLPHLLGIAGDCRPAAVLTTAAVRDSVREGFVQAPELARLRWLVVDDVDDGRAVDWKRPDLRLDDIVMLQYTSGSVGRPKGVLLSHGNLASNQAMISGLFGHGQRAAGVLWLPHTFDMGSHGILQAVYLGQPLTLLSPLSFVQRPVRWLRTLSRTRATTSGGPNFAYDLCVRRIAPAEREGLDLSAWAVAFNGAEPIRRETLEAFAQAYEPYGFDRRAFLCCYGSAELTLIATGGPAGAGPVHISLDAAALARGEVVEADGAGPVRTLVSSGLIPPQTRLRIVDPQTDAVLPADRVGEICIDGPAKAVGYFGWPEESERRFRARLDGELGGFLRTGDLGFVRDGHLFVTGRHADLIIVEGRNIYAHDLEQTAHAAHAAVRSDGCAAFSVDTGGQESVVLLAEVDPGHADAPERIRRAVKAAVVAEYDVRLYDVRLLRRGSLIKTSSGKTRRAACRDAYLAGELTAVKEG